MPDFPALPLFTDAYLADTTHLDDAEHGRYLQLLMLMWRTPGCRIPNDDAWLARRLSRTPDQIQVEWRPLIAEFCQISKKWVSQKRLTREWGWLQKKRGKNQKSAKSRWDKEKERSDRNANAVRGNGVDAMPPTLPIEERKKDAAAPPLASNEEADLYRRGRQLLGENAGGLVSKLLKAKNGSIPLARAAIEQSATKDKPREYIGRVVAGQQQPEFPLNHQGIPTNPFEGMT